MTFLTALTILLYAVALLAGAVWLVRRQAKAPPPLRTPPPHLADIRREPDPEAPIIGWIVREEPSRPNSAKSRRPY
jgi:hypothetical protein